MSNLQLKYKSTGVLKVSITNFLELGKAITDVTDAFFVLKSNADKTDAQGVFTAQMNVGGGISVQGNDLLIPFVATDFGVGKIENKKQYLIALGVEFNSSGYFTEDKDDNLERKVDIIPNKIDTTPVV